MSRIGTVTFPPSIRGARPAFTGHQVQGAANHRLVQAWNGAGFAVAKASLRICA